MNPVVHVADSVLEDLPSFLQEAAGLAFRPLPRNPAVRVSAASSRAAWLCSQVEQRTGRRVQWHPGSGNYRRTTARDAAATGCSSFIHADYRADVIALWYLNPSEECHGGTGFYRHRETALDGLHDAAAFAAAAQRAGLSRAALSQMLERDARDPRRWDLASQVEMRSNRLLVFNGEYFHSHILDFSRVRIDSVRLTIGSWGRRLDAGP